MTTHDNRPSTSTTRPVRPIAPDDAAHGAAANPVDIRPGAGGDGGATVASHPVTPVSGAMDHPRLSTRATGNHGELLAAEHLVAMGMEVVARNWRISQFGLRGELDLVALDHVNAVVVIVEVKTRRGEGFGGPLGAVDRRKRGQLRRLALAFLSQARLPYHEVRFDVVGVRLDTRHLHHVVDAL